MNDSNPYTVAPRRYGFLVQGPNGYSNKHVEASAQWNANREADALNRAYRHGFADGVAHAEELCTVLEGE